MAERTNKIYALNRKIYIPAIFTYYTSVSTCYSIHSAVVWLNSFISLNGKWTIIFLKFLSSFSCVHFTFVLLYCSASGSYESVSEHIGRCVYTLRSLFVVYASTNIVAINLVVHATRNHMHVSVQIHHRVYVSAEELKVLSARCDWVNVV